jgi:crotonobetainyl-CoA:carnitine CoA-transferase CaiB-like acyl-CoA transferase
MAYAPTVHAEAGFTANTERHFGGDLGQVLTDPLSHADVYSGLQAAIAVLAALRARERSGRGQYIDVAMAAVMIAVNERAHIDLDGVDVGAESAVLGATDGPHFVGPAGERFVAAQSITGSMTFPNYLRAMRRADLRSDPRFATAEARRANYAALHAEIQAWMLTFRDLAALDAQLDESKIAIGQVRTLKELGETEWAAYWGAVREVPDRRGGTYKLNGLPWHFSRDVPDPVSQPAMRGEHNAEVLAELGYTATEIVDYTAQGVLLAHPPG